MDEKKNILLIGVEQSLSRRAAPPLLRRIFEVDRIADPSVALELVMNVAFSALVVRFPMAGVDIRRFMGAIAQEGSASQHAPIVLLALAPDIPAAQEFVGDGVKAVINLDADSNSSEQVLCEIFGIHPRASARMVVKLKVTMTDDRQEAFMAQVQDISASGMFVATPRNYPIGSFARFEFTLPGNPKPFSGQAEVVRHARLDLDPCSGMGFRFITIDGGREQAFEKELEGLFG